MNAYTVLLSVFLLFLPGLSLVLNPGIQTWLSILSNRNTVVRCTNRFPPYYSLLVLRSTFYLLYLQVCMLARLLTHIWTHVNTCTRIHYAHMWSSYINEHEKISKRLVTARARGEVRVSVNVQGRSFYMGRKQNTHINSHIKGIQRYSPCQVPLQRLTIFRRNYSISRNRNWLILVGPASSYILLYQTGSKVSVIKVIPFTAISESDNRCHLLQ
jgi:hypothetical protein